MEKEAYSDQIDIYYNNQLNNELLDRIMEIDWFQLGAEKEDVKLVKGTKEDTTKVFKTQLADENYYIKSYAYRSKKQLLKNIFRPVEAVRLFKIVESLSKADVPVATPELGAVWDRSSLLIKDSLLCTPEVPGEDLYQFLEARDELSTELRQQIIGKLAEIWGKLVNGGLLHQDPSIENLVIEAKGEGIEITLVDIDNIYLLPWFPKIMIVRNLAKLRARQLSDFVSFGVDPLTEGELEQFYQRFLEVCNKKFNKELLQKEVKKQTVKRLIKYGSKEVVINNPELKEVYNKDLKVGL